MKSGYKPCDKCNGSGEVPDPAYIGKKMRTIRRGAGKSLRTVARAMDFSASYLSDLELGRRGWTTSLQKAYIRACT